MTSIKYTILIIAVIAVQIIAMPPSCAYYDAYIHYWDLKEQELKAAVKP